MLIWGTLFCLLIIPMGIAAASPYLASRAPTYIIAGFAGIVCLGLFLVQPLLAAGYLPGLGLARTRTWHRRIGAAIIVGVALHVGGLYLTSPPDTLDALLLASPTPFSIFGVAAMWGVILTAFLVLTRRRLKLRYPFWHILHNLLALMIVIASVIHAMQIEGTMGTVSKAVLCAVTLIATSVALIDVRLIRPSSASRLRRNSASDRTG